MAIYVGTTEITNIDNLVPQSGLDITDVWLGSTNVYTVWQTYEGTLPATLNANGDDMKQYQIYGATGGVGEEVDITGLSEPLCGIGTYTDSLDLSTGILTRRIKKLVLTGQENWFSRSGSPSHVFFFELAGVQCVNNIGLCTHYPNQESGSISTFADRHLLVRFATDGTKSYVMIRDTSIYVSTISDFKSYIAQFYTSGNPIIVWYATAEPEVSTITVPPGLTGVIEGYLIQDGTPTIETPIYPTANGIKQADDTYSIRYCYLPIGVKSGNLFNKSSAVVYNAYISTGDIWTNSANAKSIKIKVKPSTTYTISTFKVLSNFRIAESDDENVEPSSSSIVTNVIRLTNAAHSTFTTTANAKALIFQGDNNDYQDWINSLMIKEGNVMPAKYQPYYNTVTPVYIGDTPLEKDEYADYKSQKVYRMIDGTLTPTDPPVALPALPTCEGETVVDYAGSGAAPEKMFMKYRKEGF